MVVAEFSVTPVGLGDTSERAIVGAAVQAARDAGASPRVGPFGTAIEGSLDEVLDVVKRAHRAALDAGARRVLLELRVDDRRDKRETIGEQVQV